MGGCQYVLLSESSAWADHWCSGYCCLFLGISCENLYAALIHTQAKINVHPRLCYILSETKHILLNPPLPPFTQHYVILWGTLNNKHIPLNWLLFRLLCRHLHWKLPIINGGTSARDIWAKAWGLRSPFGVSWYLSLVADISVNGFDVLFCLLVSIGQHIHQPTGSSRVDERPCNSLSRPQVPKHSGHSESTLVS